MRETKFRGKRIDNGEWVYGSLLQSEIDVNKSFVKCQIHQRFSQDFSIAIYDVIPESVGQYTGLKDKNGKEIYEGDICFTESEQYSRNKLVVWNENIACFEFDYMIGKSILSKESIEVIDNIYDTPELLI